MVRSNLIHYQISEFAQFIISIFRLGRFLLHGLLNNKYNN
jgi:hypothetical protein